MLKVPFAVAAVATTVPALAAPVHLDCTTVPNGGGNPSHIRISLDEANRVATVTFLDDGVTSPIFPAEFGADKVVIDNSIVPLSPSATTIDRVNLRIASADLASGKGSHGQCHLARAAKRKF
jgi:hypothetical protein